MVLILPSYAFPIFSVSKAIDEKESFCMFNKMVRYLIFEGLYRAHCDVS